MITDFHHETLKVMNQGSVRDVIRGDSEKAWGLQFRALKKKQAPEPGSTTSYTALDRQEWGGPKPDMRRTGRPLESNPMIQDI